MYKKFLLLIRSLHIYFSMLALILLLFFALTGFMMNHSEWFKVDQTAVSDSQAQIPAELISPKADEKSLAQYLRVHCGVKGEAEISGLADASDDHIQAVFKSPRFRFDVDIAKSDGRATISKTTQSLAGFLGNLHKGEDTGPTWHRIIDATSILLAFISLTGLLLWMSLGKRRALGLISLVLCLIVSLAILFLFVPW